MTTIAIQYLESGPDVATITPEQARRTLRTAFELLPISYLLLGWNLSESLVAVCRDETTRAGAQLYRWHPFLSGDGVFDPRPEWRTIGVNSEPLSGFQDFPEFTFVCPNKPAARDAVLEHLTRNIEGDTYDGIFLDRIRFPTATEDPGAHLACFCDDCQRAAAEEGVDLDDVRRALQSGVSEAGGAVSLLNILLGGDSTEESALFNAFLDFRERSITRVASTAHKIAKEAGLSVGLDCLSPVLMRMAGQDMRSLAACSDWIKPMIYGHALGPAGLPFELLNLTEWLLRKPPVEESPIGETTALAHLAHAARLPMPETRADLREYGLSPNALRIEAERGKRAGVDTLLAGIELVEMEGVCHLTPEQIRDDLHALHHAGADGLVLAWDLWHIPLDRLKIVRETYFPG